MNRLRNSTGSKPNDVAMNTDTETDYAVRYESYTNVIGALRSIKPTEQELEWIGQRNLNQYRNRLRELLEEEDFRDDLDLHREIALVEERSKKTASIPHPPNCKRTNTLYLIKELCWLDDYETTKWMMIWTSLSGVTSVSMEKYDG